MFILAFIITNLNFKNIYKILIFAFLLIVNINNNFSDTNLEKINTDPLKERYCEYGEIYNEMGTWTYFSKRINKDKILILCKN